MVEYIDAVRGRSWKPLPRRRISIEFRADRVAAVLPLYTWERERLFTLAKGMAGAAVTVLTALIADAIENKTSKTSADYFMQPQPLWRCFSCGVASS